MRSLTAALNAARPGCGEIRRILTSSQFRPRLPGLTKLVSRLSRDGHWQKGLEVFESLPEMGLTPDTTITNAAISACDRGGQWEKALQIFYNMDTHGLCRDTITYSSVISALSKGRQCSLAIDVFNHMMNANVHPDAVTCCSLISALDKGGMWQIAEQVFISMYAEHPQYQMLLLSMDDALDQQTKDRMLVVHQSRTPRGNEMGRMHSMPTITAANNCPPGFNANSLARIMSGPQGAQPMVPPRTWSRSPPLPPLDQRRSSSLSSAGGVQAQIDKAIQNEEAAKKSWFNNNERPKAAIKQEVNDVLGSLSIEDAIAEVEQGPQSDNPSSGLNLSIPSPVPPRVDSPSTPSKAGVKSEASNPPTPSLTPQTVPASAGPTPFAALSSGHPPLSPGPPKTNSSLNHLATPFSASDYSFGSTPTAARASSFSMQRALTEIPEANYFPQVMDTMRALSFSNDELDRAAGRFDGSIRDGFSHGLNPCPMERALSAPAPSASAILRTRSISNRKTAPNRVCCNALLAAYARAHPPQWLKALRLLELMWECGGEVCPDIVSYNTVMKACGNGQQLDMAFKVYHNMRVRGLEPSIATFGTLITVASDAQRYDRVIEVWEWLQQSGMELNITCANAFLSALEKEGRWNDALQFFNSLLSSASRVKPNAVTFNIIMSSYQKRSQPDKVVYVFEDMFTAGVEPSIITYNTLICAYGQMGDWHKALDVLKHLIANDSNVQPTLATFNQVLAALSEGALNADAISKPAIAQAAWDVFQHMVSTNTVQPDMVSYNTVITALQRVGETQLVRKLVSFMNSVTLDNSGGRNSHDGNATIHA